MGKTSRQPSPKIRPRIAFFWEKRLHNLLFFSARGCPPGAYINSITQKCEKVYNFFSTREMDIFQMRRSLEKTFFFSKSGCTKWFDLL
jgi:hypothetical protein